MEQIFQVRCFFQNLTIRLLVQKDPEMLRYVECDFGLPIDAIKKEAWPSYKFPLTSCFCNYDNMYAFLRDELSIVNLFVLLPVQVTTSSANSRPFNEMSRMSSTFSCIEKSTIADEEPDRSLQLCHPGAIRPKKRQRRTSRPTALLTADVVGDKAANCPEELDVH